MNRKVEQKRVRILVVSITVAFCLLLLALAWDEVFWGALVISSFILFGCAAYLVYDKARWNRIHGAPRVPREERGDPYYERFYR